MAKTTVEDVTTHVNTSSCDPESEFKQAIHIWIESNDPKAALTPAEIGALDGFDRIDALRKSAILQLSIYYRDHPKSDVAPGLISLSHMMADNNHGVCSLSQENLGMVLHRSRDSISSAVSRLTKEGRLANLGSPGKTTILKPIIPSELACRNHIVWLSEALATSPVRSTLHQKPVRSILHDGQKPVRSILQVKTEPVRSTLHNFTKLKKETNNSSDMHAEIAFSREPQPPTPETKNSEPQGPLNSGPSLGESKQQEPSPTVPANDSQLHKCKKPASVVAEQKALLKALKEAAGDVLKDRVGHFTEVQKWIDAGCDLERDIVPAILTVGETALRRLGPKSVATWTYFRNPVYEARDARLAAADKPTQQKRINGYSRLDQAPRPVEGFPGRYHGS
jgi:hypothetical protein